MEGSLARGAPAGAPLYGLSVVCGESPHAVAHIYASFAECLNDMNVHVHVPYLKPVTRTRTNSQGISVSVLRRALEHH